MVPISHRLIFKAVPAFSLCLALLLQSHALFFSIPPAYRLNYVAHLGFFCRLKLQQFILQVCLLPLLIISSPCFFLNPKTRLLYPQYPLFRFCCFYSRPSHQDFFVLEFSQSQLQILVMSLVVAFVLSMYRFFSSCYYSLNNTM